MFSCDSGSLELVASHLFSRRFLRSARAERKDPACFGGKCGEHAADASAASATSAAARRLDAFHAFTDPTPFIHGEEGLRVGQTGLGRKN